MPGGRKLLIHPAGVPPLSSGKPVIYSKCLTLGQKPNYRLLFFEFGQMPHAFALYKELKTIPFPDNQCLVVASVIEHARSGVGDGRFSPNSIIHNLVAAGFTNSVASAMTQALRACFWREQHASKFIKTDIKFDLVRSGMASNIADAFLDCLEPCVLARKDHSLRVGIHKHPGASTVVMCDFRFLRVPEMQKERRAIILCQPQKPEAGRCVVVPVSMSPPRQHNVHHVEIAPGQYPCFHRTNSVYVVCDHVYTVSFSRVWQVNVGRAPSMPKLKPPDFARVQASIRGALCF